MVDILKTRKRFRVDKISEKSTIMRIKIPVLDI